MKFSIYDFKEALYAALALFGATLLVLGICSLKTITNETASAGSFIAGMILTFVGIASLFFCVETFILRDDVDIWR